jgi:hypothetical protein
MSNAAQRSFLWVLGIVALLGNTSVIIWRYRNIFVSPVSSTLILSLGCADFFMGIYLVIIASVDVHYRLEKKFNSNHNNIVANFQIFTIPEVVTSKTLIFGRIAFFVNFVVFFPLFHLKYRSRH